MKYIEAGDKSQPIMFFIHGWPDSPKLWQKQFDYFASRYRCIAVALPNFLEPEDQPPGMDFPELTADIIRTIEDVCASSAQGQVILIGHDWGAYLAYRIEQAAPHLISRIVTFDVGADMQPDSLGHALFVISYQWWLAAAFLIGKVLPPVGGAMNLAFTVMARTPKKSASAHINYPYFYLWRAIFFKRFRPALLRNYRPTRPLLYLYGNSKPYHFHSKRWLSQLKSWPGSQFVSIPGHGHWFMLTAPELTNGTVEQWLNSGL